MEIEVQVSMSFDDLKKNCWSGAIKNLEEIEEAGLEDELMSHLADIFYEETTPTLTAINDYLRFDDYINNDFINEHTTLDDIDSLEELKEYVSNSDVYDVLDTAINSDYADELWDYISDGYMGDSLATIIKEISSLEPNDYIGLDCIQSLDEFINLVKDNDTVMEVINAIKKANLTDEYWNKLEEECKGINYTIANVVDDIESLDVDELIESL